MFCITLLLFFLSSCYHLAHKWNYFPCLESRNSEGCCNSCIPVFYFSWTVITCIGIAWFTPTEFRINKEWYHLQVKAWKLFQQVNSVNKVIFFKKQLNMRETFVTVKCINQNWNLGMPCLLKVQKNFLMATKYFESSFIKISCNYWKEKCSYNFLAWDSGV